MAKWLQAHDGGTVLSERPRIWVQRHFISAEEASQLLSAADAARCWQRVSDPHYECNLEGNRQMEATDVMRQVDARVAAALNVSLSHIEHGYIQRYHAGYQMPHNAHMDQDQHDMTPARIASAIIYLEDQPLGSGHTVFPLAAIGGHRGVPSAPGDTGVRNQLVAKWNAWLQQGLVRERAFRPLRRSDSGIVALGSTELFELAVADCAAGGGIRPQQGLALFFEQRVAGVGGALRPQQRLQETIETLHASCGLAPTASTKHALVKWACDGPCRTSS